MQAEGGRRLLQRAPSTTPSRSQPLRPPFGTRPPVAGSGGQLGASQHAAEQLRARSAATADLATAWPEADEGLRDAGVLSAAPAGAAAAAPGGGLAAERRGRGAQDPIMDEIHGCEEIEDVLEVLDEEADGAAGYLVADAVLKCVNLAKKSAGRPGKAARAQLVRVGRSEAFQSLLEWIALKAHAMEARDLAVCLWSLATMQVKVVRLLRLLQQELEPRVCDMNAQDISMALWAFGALKYSPGPLMDALAHAAARQLERFEPQGLSMSLWAYAKLDHVPPQELLQGGLATLQARLDDFSPQSVANIVYAMGKLQQQCPVELCARVEARVAAAPARFKDIELANTLYGFVRSRCQPAQLMAAIEDRIAARQLDKQTLSLTWATLVWGAGSLGLRLRDSTLAALDEWALEAPEDYAPVSICNMLWGMAIMGQVRHPAFQRVLAAAVASHQRRALEPRLLRQLFQAVATARVLGCEADIPEELEATAYKWWRKATLGLPISVAQDVVGKAVRRLVPAVEVQADAGYGLPLVDLALRTPDGARLAVKVASRTCRAANTGEMLGRTQHDRMLLEAAGWRVAVLEMQHLPPFHDKPAVIAHLGRWLVEQGVPCNWEAAAASAPPPAPRSVRMRPPAQGRFSQREREDRGGARRERRRQSDEEADAPRRGSWQPPHADRAVASPAAYRQERGASAQPAEGRTSAAREAPWGAALPVQVPAAAPAAVAAAAEDVLSEEERLRAQQQRQERAAQVSEALSEASLADWGLGEWSALKVVQPGQPRSA